MQQKYYGGRLTRFFRDNVRNFFSGSHESLPNQRVAPFRVPRIVNTIQVAMASVRYVKGSALKGEQIVAVACRDDSISVTYKLDYEWHDTDSSLQICEMSNPVYPKVCDKIRTSK